jgi:hypothetical protein
MIGDFDTILRLVGVLDDSAGNDPPRLRFREYLKSSLTELGAVRDAVQTCVTNSGPQYARALQDLVNHIGTLMGFDVEFGRYAGVVGQIGHDGLWRSGENVLVLETKTTDAYTINTATLLNYINSLRSEGTISAADRVIGIYVYAKTDPHVKQLEHAIIAEKRTQELRVASAEAILSLAELIRHELITHDEALAILWPSGVWIDDSVGLLSRVSAASTEVATLPAPAALPTPDLTATGSAAGGMTNVPVSAVERLHVLTPVADIAEETARETIERLLPAGVYAFGVNTPHRTKLKPGDRIAFYQTTVGVVADAEVETAPEYKPLPIVKNESKYPWTFQVRNVHLYLDQPIVIDAEKRSKLDAFEDKEPQKGWAWFVQVTRLLSVHDYALLTNSSDPSSDS